MRSVADGDGTVRGRGGGVGQTAADPAAWTACSSRTCVSLRDRFASAQRSLKNWLVADAARVCGVSAAARSSCWRCSEENGGGGSFGSEFLYYLFA